MDALNSGEDFDTGWWGCKKEIRYARIVREDGEITVEVSCCMDDLWDGNDLIYDALWEERHTEEKLPDDIIDSIRDTAIDDGIDDNSRVSDSFLDCRVAVLAFDDIVDRIARLEETAENMNSNMYARLRGIVAAHYDYWKGEQSNRKDDHGDS